MGFLPGLAPVAMVPNKKGAGGSSGAEGFSRDAVRREIVSYQSKLFAFRDRAGPEVAARVGCGSSGAGVGHVRGRGSVAFQ
jgi:hypothetical protein